MKIFSSSARIEGCSPSTMTELPAFLDTVSECGGFVVGAGGYPICSYLLVAKKGDRIFLLAAPSVRWRQDIIDSGYEIIQEFKQEGRER